MVFKPDGEPNTDDAPQEAPRVFNIKDLKGQEGFGAAVSKIDELRTEAAKKAEEAEAAKGDDMDEEKDKIEEVFKKEEGN